jgi:hypothetical protein
LIAVAGRCGAIIVVLGALTSVVALDAGAAAITDGATVLIARLVGVLVYRHTFPELAGVDGALVLVVALRVQGALAAEDECADSAFFLVRILCDAKEERLHALGFLQAILNTEALVAKDVWVARADVVVETDIAVLAVSVDVAVDAAALTVADGAPVLAATGALVLVRIRARASGAQVLGAIVVVRALCAFGALDIRHAGVAFVADEAVIAVRTGVALDAGAGPVTDGAAVLVAAGALVLIRIRARA